MKQGFTTRDLRRAGRRILIALLVEGDGEYPWLYERDLVDFVQVTDPAPLHITVAAVIDFFLLGKVGILFETGRSPEKGRRLQLTPKGLAEAKRGQMLLQATMAKENRR